MTTRTETDFDFGFPGHRQSEVAVREVVERQAPMGVRFTAHQERIDGILRELESERPQLLSRRDDFRRQLEAVEQTLAVQIDDTEATLQIYKAGLNSSVATV